LQDRNAPKIILGIIVATELVKTMAIGLASKKIILEIALGLTIKAIGQNVPMII